VAATLGTILLAIAWLFFWRKATTMIEALDLFQMALRALLVAATIGASVVGVVLACRYLIDLARVRPRVIHTAARLPRRRPPTARPRRKKSDLAWRHGSVDLPDHRPD